MPTYNLSFPPKDSLESFEDSLVEVAISLWADRIGADLVLTIATHRSTGGLMIIPHSKWPMNHQEVQEILRTATTYIDTALAENPTDNDPGEPPEPPDESPH